MFQIGPHKLASRVVLAPMAGVTDLPFRQLCRRFGAGLVVSEMVTSDTRLWHTRKSQQRLNHQGEAEPRAVQIAGGDATMMATAAALNVERGAQIIDINMGCPAKKVCRKAAGSALMKDPQLVTDILQAVVSAVNVPVTLKIRTGWSAQQRNGVDIAKIAEDCGISALAVHGRTRACGFGGSAEYDTVAEIKAAVSIPVIANGDIDSPSKALHVMQYTGADAVMIGRAAQGRPWLCRQIDQYLRSGDRVASPDHHEIQQILLDHLDALYAFYGEFMGVKIARKHVGHYLKANSLKISSLKTENLHNDYSGSEHLPAQRIQKPDKSVNNTDFRSHFNRLDSAQRQHQAINDFFEDILAGNTASCTTTPFNHDHSTRNQSHGATTNQEVFAA